MFQSRFVGMTICMCTMPRNTPLALVTMRNGFVPPLTFQLHIIIIISSEISIPTNPTYSSNYQN